MFKYVSGVLLWFVASYSSVAIAQQSVWVQIEAQRSLGQAQEVARSYSSDLRNVSGYALQSGWYAITIGPFALVEAESFLQELRATRQIPTDSYIVNGSSFRRQFWPLGSDLGTTETASQSDAPTPSANAIPPMNETSETVAQARRSEKQLSRSERMLLQTALQFEGHYTAAIDGAFGPGTRKSMAAWQGEKGFESSGVLTTQQRLQLTIRYLEIVGSLGFSTVTEQVAGIQIDLPMALVEFDRYDPPFAFFKSRSNENAEVLLISQRGDQDTLRGLFDIMQTLDMVPLDGPREFRGDSFTLTGNNTELSSYTFATLVNGNIKGFTLIWFRQSEKRKELVIKTMLSSFIALEPAVLPDDYGNQNAVQSLDLLAGLDIRRPLFSRSGFYVDPAGSLLTSAQGISACNRLTVDGDYLVEIEATDQELGVALLRPLEANSPISIAQIATSSPKLNSEIALAGYSFGGILGAPTLTFGMLADLSGLNGESELSRLEIAASPGDVGGPVFSKMGSVIGMLLPRNETSGRKLPDNVRFASGSNALSEFLINNNVELEMSQASTQLAPEDLTEIAAEMTVLISCWDS